MTKQAFWTDSLLGKSLLPHSSNPLISSLIHYENTHGLPAIYNASIQSEKTADILLFIHDDVYLSDPKFFEKIEAGLKHFDVIGVAGNKRIVPYQPAWAFKEIYQNEFLWDHGHLSGSVMHGDESNHPTTVFGSAPQACELLDGVLIAAKRNILKSSAAYFDERFRFHFYDLDFCRNARKRGLTLGTWPIDVIHQSGGLFGSPVWLEASQIYFQKWKH